jgi:hypothetical protein
MRWPSTRSSPYESGSLVTDETHEEDPFDTGPLPIVQVVPQNAWTRIGVAFAALALVLAILVLGVIAHESLQTAKSNRNAGQCRAKYQAAAYVAESRALASLAIDSLADQFKDRVLAFEDAADRYQKNVDDCHPPKP